MKFCVFLIFALVAHMTTAQNLLLKKDGQHVAYKKIKKSNDDRYFEIILENKSKIKVLKDDVVGYYDGFSKKVTYKKPVVSDNEILLLSNDSDSVNGIQVVERVLPGKITLYKKVINQSYTSGGMYYGNSTTYYYGEKGEEFKNIWITGMGSKDDDIASLKSLIDDDPELVKKVSSDAFGRNEKNMLKVIEEYNLKHFTKPATINYATTGLVGFFTTVAPNLKESITITINDSTEHKFSKSYYPLPVKLPLNVPSKVCVSSESNTLCRLIQPIQFATDYFELDYAASKKSFEIETSSERQVEMYLENMRRSD